MSLKGFDVLYGEQIQENQFDHSPEQISLFDLGNEKTAAPQASFSQSVEQQESFYNIAEKASEKSIPVLSASKASITPIVASVKPKIIAPTFSSSIAVQAMTRQEFFSYSFSTTFQTFKDKALSWLNEIKVFGALFLGVLVVFYFFTNAQLIFLMAQDIFGSFEAKDSTTISQQFTHQAAPLQQDTKSTLEDLQQKVAMLKLKNTQELALSLHEFLAQKDQNQTLNFNLLPPTNRLIIPDLNLNVPLVDTDNAGKIDFSDENFDDELEKGVVKYPTTPMPGEK